MRLVATGISGVAKLEVANEVARYLHEQKNQSMEVLDVWTHIQAVARELGIEVTKEKILDHEQVDSLRALAFERICARLKDVPNTPTSHSMVTTHACFRWNKYLRKGFDVHYLNQINPDCYVNIIDDFHVIRRRLNGDVQWKGRLTDPEIITWRDEETFITETFAQFQFKRFWLIARSEPIATLSNLIAEPQMKKIYLSYPITAIEEQLPELVTEAEQFADQLRAKYVVFNPLSIKDLVAHPDPAEETTKDLRENTVWRDLKLIRQSDMVVVYYPVNYNSPGANREIGFGFSNGKSVYLFYPHSLSPFWDPNISITERFDTYQALHDFLLRDP